MYKKIYATFTSALATITPSYLFLFFKTAKYKKENINKKRLFHTKTDVSENFCTGEITPIPSDIIKWAHKFTSSAFLDSTSRFNLELKGLRT